MINKPDMLNKSESAKIEKWCSQKLQIHIWSKMMIYSLKLIISNPIRQCSKMMISKNQNMPAKELYVLTKSQCIKVEN